MPTDDSNLDRSFTNLPDAVQALTHHGVQVALVKVLAPRNDNSKNQIVIGTDRSMTTYFPGRTRLRGKSTSTQKAHSAPGQPILATDLDFRWLYPDGSFRAPYAQVIDYLQYPEARLSGFLQGCKRGPRALVKTEQHKYGRRVLILGIAETAVFGILVTDHDNIEMIDELAALPQSSVQNILLTLLLPTVGGPTNQQRLLAEIDAIAGTPRRAMALRSGSRTPRPIPARGQAGGWTLEAELHVFMNGTPGADKYGHEVKAVGGNKVSIITTEPDLGFRKREGFQAFMEKYGRDSRVRPGYRGFVGVHKCGIYQPSTDCTLTINHWDFDSNNPDGEGEPEICLISRSTGEVVAGWSFRQVAAHWMKKHEGAVYVQTETVLLPGEAEPTHYVYGPRVLVGSGTNPVLLFRAVANGIVVIDPGDRINPLGEAKPRTQWRVPGAMMTSKKPWERTQLPARLAHLYDRLEVRDDGVVVARFVQGQYSA